MLGNSTHRVYNKYSCVTPHIFHCPPKNTPLKLFAIKRLK